MISKSSLHFAYLRALFFEHDAEIRQVSEQSETPKGHLWTGTSWVVALETLTIRSMQTEDIAKVLELEEKTLSAWSDDHLKDELQQPTGFQFVVSNKRTEKILAVLFGRIVVDEAEILKLSVANFARNRGLGYQLLDFSINYCSSKGAKNCYLELRASNEVARRLYEKRGFITVRTRNDYYDEPVEDAILMQCEL